MGWDYVAVRVINFIRGITMNGMPPDKKVHRLRRGMRISHGMCLSLPPIAVLILALLPIMGFVPVTSTGSASLSEAEVFLSVSSFLLLAAGFFWPRLAGWYKKAYVDDMELYYGHIIQAGFLTTPVVFSFLLRILDSSWYIVLPPIILAFAALVITFPTDKRLARWQRGQRPSS